MTTLNAEAAALAQRQIQSALSNALADASALQVPDVQNALICRKTAASHVRIATTIGTCRRAAQLSKRVVPPGAASVGGAMRCNRKGTQQTETFVNQRSFLHRDLQSLAATPRAAIHCVHRRRRMRHCGRTPGSWRSGCTGRWSPPRPPRRSWRRRWRPGRPLRRCRRACMCCHAVRLISPVLKPYREQCQMH